MWGIEATIAEFLHSLDVAWAQARVGLTNGHVVSGLLEHVKLGLGGAVGGPKPGGL